MTTTPVASIVSFYSYKGGAGRTVALANVAWILASAGKSVLAVDWDLETPGLHGYYREFLTDRELADTTGLLDMVHDFAQRANAGGAGPEDLSELLGAATDIGRHVVGLDARFPGQGRLDYLGPGRHDAGYQDRLRAFNWNQFMASEEGAKYLFGLRERMRGGEWEYVLIDSRAGVSATSEICTALLPDAVVFTLKLDAESIAGNARVAHALAGAEGVTSRLHVLPTHSETSEPWMRHELTSAARQAFRGLLDLPDREAEENYWGSVHVPYSSYYALSRELAVLREKPTSGGVLPHYVRLADRVTDGEVSTYSAVPHHQLWPVPPTLGRPETVVLLHAPEDQAWAEWLCELLRLLGIEVLDREQGGPGRQPLPEARTLLVLFSAHLREDLDDDLVEDFAPRRGESRPPRVVTVRLDGTPLFPGIWGGSHGAPDMVSLAGLDQHAATAAVLERFGAPGAATRMAAGLRFPGRLPEVWNVEHRHPHFTGRVGLLARLRERLQAPVGAPSRVQVLLGMSGVGKSALALEYAYRFAGDYDAVWWVAAADPEVAREGLTRLAHDINRATGRGDPEDWDSLRERLRRGAPYDRWLLVLDGAGEPDELRQFVPDAGHGHVLVTTQHSAWQDVAQLLHVDEFTRPESLALLHERLPRAGAADLDRLAGALGDLPMALEHAAAWLRTASVTVAESVEQLPDAGRRGGNSPSLYPLELFDLNAGWLERAAPAAARLLDLSAFLSPDGISFRVIQSLAMREQLAAVDPALRDSMRVRQILTTLAGRSLARVDQATETVRVHRMIQLARLDRMTGEQREDTRGRALAVLASLAPPDIEADDPRHLPIYAELDKHLLVSGAVHSDDPEVRRWVANQVRYRWRRNRWQAARKLGERVLADWRKRFPEDTTTLRLATQVANIHRSLGAYTTAFEMDKETLRIQYQAQRQHDPYTLMTLRGYAAGLRAAGNFSAALAEDQTTYQNFVRAFGEDHPDSLLASANLALSWYFVGSVADAIRQENQTLELRTRVLTEQDPMTWRTHAMLGTYHRHAGELDTSAAHLVRAVRRLTELEGADAPRTLQAAKSLGLTYLAAGDLNAAVPLLGDVDLAMRRQWGEDHLETMASALAIAEVQHARGEAAEATASARDVLGRLADQLGDDHPFTAVCRSNLALYLLDGGQAAEARELSARAATQLSRAFRPDHPFALVARMNHNNALAAADNAPHAPRIVTEDESICGDCRKRWGPEHAVTLTAEANLAHSKQEDTGAAARCRRRFGEDHHLTRRLTAAPYRRAGAALEIQEV